MYNKRIWIKNRGIYLFIWIVVLFGLIIFNYSGTSVNTINQEADIKELEAKFLVLSKENTNSCGGIFNYVDSMSDNARIQGSCCGPMNFHRYVEQVEALEKYSKYEKIPPDPYDVSVSLAQELLNYQKEIILSDEQQVVLILENSGTKCKRIYQTQLLLEDKEHLIL